MSESTALPSGPVAFIGGGNMARSLIGGLVARGFAPAGIRVAEPVEALRAELQRDFGVACFDNAQAAAEGAAVWLLAVKPQVMREVCAALSAQARAPRPLAG
ncbi:NAD(P)-binding domain-containing protein, partial [Lysobacter gummosus]|uniref:NAD(P)-binding domain-containing protein n=1 Tax=Lysobacter gummosus TaxID=262324 RepID=UPI00363DD484